MELTTSSSEIILISVRESDISEEYLETLNDSEYMKFSRNSGFTHTIASQLKYLSGFENSRNLHFGIEETKDNQLVGTINCYVDFKKMTLNLGFLVFKNRQSKGYSSKALEILLPYLESQFPGMTAVIGCHEANYAMKKIAEKFDFALKSKHKRLNGVYLTLVRTFPKLNSQSTPLMPDIIRRSIKIGVAAYDAGGAEQISWIVRNIPRKVTALVDGPAERIFETANILFDKVTQVQDLMGCDLVITGSGWMSPLEDSVIRAANLRNIPCLTILDHWVNFRERFEDDEIGQPQILGVTNKNALILAQEIFPEKLVLLFPDYQVESYRNSILDHSKTRSVLLVLLEPTSELNGKFSIRDETIDKLLISAVSIKFSKGLDAILVRRHPSQSGDQLISNVLKNHPGEFEISESPTLIDDLKVSQVVLGLSSYALYIASMCGLTTFSCFAGQKGHWTEMFPQISMPPSQ